MKRDTGDDDQTERLRQLRACLSDEDWRRLHVLAAERGVTFQDLVSEVLRAAVERQ